MPTCEFSAERGPAVLGRRSMFEGVDELEWGMQFPTPRSGRAACRFRVCGKVDEVTVDGSTVGVASV